MSIRLNHTVVYAKNHAASVREFTAVHINSELSIYFMNHDNITLEQHLAFDVDGHFFDLMLNQLKEKKIPFGSTPFERENHRTDHDFASCGIFWTNMDGCLFYIMTNERYILLLVSIIY